MKRMVMFIVASMLVQPSDADTCKAPRIKQGMRYSAARSSILKAGFQAPSGPRFGYKEGDQKVVSECNGDVKVCNAFPEIEACSGEGICMMVFTDAYGNSLRVSAEGEIGTPRFSVANFEMQCKGSAAR